MTTSSAPRSDGKRTRAADDRPWGLTLDRYFATVASSIAALPGHPSAAMIAFGVIVVWGVSGPIFGWSDTWQLVINTGTTIVTFLMVFLIQNSQNRDAAAMQAKLDELIRAIENARGQFIGIEHLTDGEIERIRASLEEEARQCDADAATSSAAVDRLLGRR